MPAKPTRELEKHFWLVHADSGQRYFPIRDSDNSYELYEVQGKPAVTGIKRVAELKRLVVEKGYGVRVLSEDRQKNTIAKLYKQKYNDWGPKSISASELPIPGDLDGRSIPTKTEGKTQVLEITKYERDARLRRRAIEFHGVTCSVCLFNFGDTYGELGRGFIHIHHRVPVSEGERTPDIETDLVALCANCHSMVHREAGKCLSVEDLVRAYKLQRSKRAKMR
jgi:5-methylcytosine-specific restriction endonuclease McrA